MDFIPTDTGELLESSTTDAINELTTFDKDQVMCDVTRKHVYENLSGKLVPDQECQTVYSKYELSAKVETMILKNEVSTSKLPPPKIVSTLSYENIVRDAVLMKHFIGLTPSQFEVLHNFLDAVVLWSPSTIGPEKIVLQRITPELALKVIFRQGRNYLFAF